MSGCKHKDSERFPILLVDRPQAVINVTNLNETVERSRLRMPNLCKVVSELSQSLGTN